MLKAILISSTYRITEQDFSVIIWGIMQKKDVCKDGTLKQVAVWDQQKPTGSKLISRKKNVKTLC